MWKPVVGFEGLYEVSDTGDVKSLGRYLPCGTGVRFHKGKRLKLKFDRFGYPQVALAGTTKRVHVLVAEAFLGPRPSKHEVRHLNDIPKDNRVDNLAWGTSSDNKRDAVKNGKHHYSRRDRCKNGHLYTEDNIYMNEDVRSGRTCLVCRRKTDAKRRPRVNKPEAGDHDA